MAERVFLLAVLYGSCAWEIFGSAGVEVDRFANPRTAATQFRLATKWVVYSRPLRDSSMTNSAYIPLTAIDCTITALLIDRNAPLDVLHANAAARVLAVTQLMGTFSSRDVQDADAIDLKQLATTAMILLRDGCDLLNVLGWRLQPT